MNCLPVGVLSARVGSVHDGALASSLLCHFLAGALIVCRDISLVGDGNLEIGGHGGGGEKKRRGEAMDGWLFSGKKY